MFVYLSNILISVICTLSNKTISIGDKVVEKKKLECIVFSFLWIIISGFRSISVGPDTASYGDDFIRITNTPWSVLWNNLVSKAASFQSLFANNQLNKDPGFLLLTKGISIIAPTYRLYLILVAIIFMSLLGRFLYRHSSNPFLGFVIFDCLFYSFYAITGIRQTIATALIVLLGYDYVKDKKIIKFAIVAAIAFFIHKSSVCFVPFYFLSRIKVNRVSASIFGVIIVGTFIFRRQMMNVLSIFMGYEQYNRQWHYGDAGPITFTLLLIAVFVFCVFFHKRMMENDKEFQYKFIALGMALTLLPLAFIDPSAMRVSYYYALFLMVLLPDMIEVFDEKQQMIVSFGVTIVMIFLLISNAPVYKFFWVDG